MTRDLLATVRTDAATPDDFGLLAGIFGRPSKADEALAAELAAALSEHRDAIQATFRSDAKLWDQIIARDALNAEYEARVQAIKAKHAEQFTEVHGDPLLNKRRAA